MMHEGYKHIEQINMMMYEKGLLEVDSQMMMKIKRGISISSYYHLRLTTSVNNLFQPFNFKPIISSLLIIIIIIPPLVHHFLKFEYPRYSLVLVLNN